LTVWTTVCSYVPNHSHKKSSPKEPAELAPRSLARENLHKALVHYQASCQQHPDNADAWFVLAGLYAQLGRIEDVEHCCCRVIALQGDNAAARYNLGVALQQQGKTETAISCYQELLTMQPDHAAAHANLGLLYHESKKPDKAEVHARQAIILQADNAPAHNTLGLVYLDQEHYSEAVDCFRRAIRLDPGYAQGHYNLGLALLRSGDPEKAARCFQLALTLQPDNPDVLNDLGSACKAMGNYALALQHYSRAIQANPDHAEAHWNRSLVLLLTGNYAEGWKEYEWRWKSANRLPRRIAGPAWQGEPLNGCRILLYNEQGLGDGIQFIRYAPVLKALGATVIAEVPGELARVLATCTGIDQVIVQGEDLPAFDIHAPLMSLPRLLNTREETIPAGIPYLYPPQDSNAVISRLCEDSQRGLRAGIVWAGNPQHPNDRNRSCPARHLSSISNLPGVQLFSLQKGARAPELDTIEFAGSIIDLAGHFRDFADTAQALGHLDLLITVDTSVAHLAGAMGRPVWVMLPFVPDWRWQLNRNDSPWYPSMRLFRQPRPGDWTSVIESIRKDLVACAESNDSGMMYE